MGITNVPELLKMYRIPYRYMYGSQFEFVHPTWDGGVLTLGWQGPSSDSCGESIEWAFHEVSHYLFAPPWARRLPNYGLGSDPGGGANTVVVEGAARSGDTWLDESTVCVLDLILMSKHGMGPEFLDGHSRNYNITGEGTRVDLLLSVGATQEQVRSAMAYLESL